MLLWKLLNYIRLITLVVVDLNCIKVILEEVKTVALMIMGVIKLSEKQTTTRVKENVKLNFYTNNIEVNSVDHQNKKILNLKNDSMNQILDKVVSGELMQRSRVGCKKV